MLWAEPPQAPALNSPPKPQEEINTRKASQFDKIGKLRDQEKARRQADRAPPSHNQDQLANNPIPSLWDLQITPPIPSLLDLWVSPPAGWDHHNPRRKTKSYGKHRYHP
jgi:hypothetical protein